MIQTEINKGMETTETCLVMRRKLAYPREAVFRAWVDPQAIRQWFFPREGWTIDTAEVDLRPQGNYRVAMTSDKGEKFTVVGTYREVTPPARLVFSWAWPDEPGLGETLVTLELHEDGEGTELVLKHEGFPNSAARDEHMWGWTGCWNNFEKYLATH